MVRDAIPGAGEQFLRDQMANEMAREKERLQEKEVTPSLDELATIKSVVDSLKSQGIDVSDDMLEGIKQDVVGARERIAESDQTRESRENAAGNFLLAEMESLTGDPTLAEEIFEKRIDEKGLNTLTKLSEYQLKELANVYVRAESTEKVTTSQEKPFVAPEDTTLDLPQAASGKASISLTSGVAGAGSVARETTQSNIRKSNDKENQKQLREILAARIHAKIEAGDDPNDLMMIVEGELENTGYRIDELEEEASANSDNDAEKNVKIITQEHGSESELNAAYQKRENLDAQRDILLAAGAASKKEETEVIGETLNEEETITTKKAIAAKEASEQQNAA